jgi:hypothetical protein
MCEDCREVTGGWTHVNVASSHKIRIYWVSWT